MIACWKENILAGYFVMNDNDYVIDVLVPVNM